MLSRQIDGPARMAYAHIPVERPRQFIIIGTTNNNEYLADATGARRFWPIKVGRFDVEGLIKDRDQLWAEAVHREAAGESIRLAEGLWSAAGAHQEQRREVDAWEDILAAHVEGLDTSTVGRQQVSADALWNAIGVPNERRDRGGSKRIAEIMQRLTFERKNVREDDVVKTGYVRHVKGQTISRTPLQQSIDAALSPQDRKRLDKLRNDSDM
jgi:predicted P-loop ATPase